MAQRAEMRRQAGVTFERESARRVDELGKRRRQKARRKREQLDARTRSVLTLQRLLERAVRVDDERLEAGLRAAIDALSVELVAKPRRVA